MKTRVICINEDFPIIASDGDTNKHKGKQALCYPKKGEVLEIDEEGLDFYRFNKYDSSTAFNWWHKSRFELLETHLIRILIASVTNKIAELSKIDGQMIKITEQNASTIAVQLEHAAYWVTIQKQCDIILD